MPRCGATFGENSVPPWTRGAFRGVLGYRNLAVATSSRKTDSPPSTSVEDEHDDEDEKSTEGIFPYCCHQPPSPLGQGGTSGGFSEIATSVLRLDHRRLIPRPRHWSRTSTTTRARRALEEISPCCCHQPSSPLGQGGTSGGVSGIA